MKNYFYCEANNTVYTEREKTNSTFPGHRFEMIGEFKNRAQAESAWMANHPMDTVGNEKRI